MMFPVSISGIKVVFTGIPILVTLVNAERSRFLSTTYNGKKIFGKEGKDLNLTWEYEILPPYGTKVEEFLFGEWKDPGFVSRKCFKVDKNGKVFKAKGCESKYDYKVDGSNGNYNSSVVIYNLTKSDMEKKYGIDIEMGIYRTPLEDWFELHTFVKAKITHFSISGNATMKEGDAVNITCRATGRPEAIVTLYKQEMDKQDQFIKKGNGEVKHQMNKTAMHHAGEYVCVASNDGVEAPDRRNITLSVEDAGEYVCVSSNDDVEVPGRRHITLSVEGETTQSPTSKSAGPNKCFSEPWILGFLFFSRWI